jgi:hypothetical protein
VILLATAACSTIYVNGTAKQDYVTGSAGNEVIRDSSVNFAGEVNQSGGVSFDFFGTTVYGTESGDILSLNLPQQGGGLLAATFHVATPEDYNSALATLRNAVSQANQQAQQQQQAVERAQAQSDAQHALGQDLSGLVSDENKLATAVAAIPGVEKKVDTASATADSKLASEKAYAGPKANCYQLSNMEYTTNSAVYDLNSAVYELNSAVYTLDNAISTLTSDIAKAKKDEETVRAVAGTVSTDTDNEIGAASSQVTRAQGSESQAKAYGDNATKHGQDVSTTAGKVATNCNTSGG